MAEPDKPSSPTSGSGWFSIDNLKWLVGTLTLPAMLFVVSQHFQERTRLDAEAANKVRLYTELINKREDSDTGVKRDVFNKLVDKYMSPDATGKPSVTRLSDKLVLLELLALNFHDSLNLSPLFWQIDREIGSLPRSEAQNLHAQLTRIAEEIKNRQVARLAPDDFLKPFDVDLHLMGKCRVKFEAQPTFQDAGLTGKEAKYARAFTVDVVKDDPMERRLNVIVRAPSLSRSWDFWIDPYDFPLANFTRVTPNERFALVLDNYSKKDGFARFRLLFFPASRIGAKDKPHLDDVMSQLLQPGGNERRTSLELPVPAWLPASERVPAELAGSAPMVFESPAAGPAKDCDAAAATEATPATLTATPASATRN